MADVEFGDFGNGGEGSDVSIGQAVAGGDDQAEAFCVGGGGPDALDFGSRPLFSFAMCCTGAECQLGIFGGAKLDLLGSDTSRGIDLFSVGVDKDADENPGRF